MVSRFVSTSDRSLLPAVRGVVAGADEAYLAVGFVGEAGVHLIAPQLRRLGGNGRLLSTTVFGSTSPAALAMARGFGNQIRVVNHHSGTYHPKVFIGRTGDRISAVVGSGNLTGGLVTNVEAGVLMEGTSSDAPLREAWGWAEGQWARPDARSWDADAGTETATGFRPELLALVRWAVGEDPVFMTLGANPRQNRVVDVTPAGIWIETDRSRTRHGGAEMIPAWMFELAWDALKARGGLSNSELLNELRVHRSSAVCAILARLPGVRVASREPIRLVVSP